MAERVAAGRRILITGGARGIGLATARVLAQGGARVVIGDTDGELAAAEAARFYAHGTALDVRQEHCFADFLEFGRERLGGIDVLVNNAGIMPTGPFLTQPPALAEEILAVNVVGVMRGTRLVLPEMLTRGSGQIINIASVAGRSVAAGMVSYCASKHAVVGFTRALRREHYGKGVRFTLVMPSFTNTRLVDGANAGRVPVAEPEEVAARVARAVAAPRDELIVPRAAAILTHGFERLLPRTVTDRIARALGADAMFMDAAGVARQAAASQAERRLAQTEAI